MTSTSHQPSAKLLRTSVSKEDKEKFKLSYSNAHVVIERILQVLRKEMESLSKDAESAARFEEPNWPVQQAYLVGQRKAVRDLINLLNAKER